MKKLTENAKKKMYTTQRRIHEATLDRIQVYVQKGDKQKIKDFASSKNMSLNAFIVDCINRTMKGDKCDK